MTENVREYPAGSARARRAYLAAEVAKFTHAIRDCEVCALIRKLREGAENEREALLPKALEEVKEERGEAKTTRVRYDAVAEEIGDQSEAAAMVATAIAKNKLGVGFVNLAKKRRACSACHVAGHVARNCPDAHLHRQRDVEKKARRDKRRKK